MSRDGDGLQYGRQISSKATDASRSVAAGNQTPPHRFAMSPSAPHFSHQDFSFKKSICLTEQRRAQGKVEKPADADVGFREAGPDEVMERPSFKQRSPSDDKQRQALIKWQHYNHRRQDFTQMKDLMQPGDQDDGDSSVGVIGEERNRYVPHWSARQFNLKKAHHGVPIHKTAENQSKPDLQSTSHAHHCDPRYITKPGESFEMGTSHKHNSHAHLSLQKRRHLMRLEHDETDFRSQHPAFPSPEPHFFASPEPNHMACHLYPEGPSLTARHVPEHFVDNVVFEHKVRGAKSTGSITSGGSRGPDSSRMSGMYVWNGTRMTPVTELFETGSDYFSRTPRQTVSPSVRSAGQSWSRGFAPRSPQEFDFMNHPGKPPSADTRRPEDGFVYKSHAQLTHDKGRCLAHAYQHTDRWERIEAGSQGHSMGGSDFGSGFGSNCGGSKRESRSVEPMRRSRSSDMGRRNGRQTPRPASAERSSRRRRADSADGRRRYG